MIHLVLLSWSRLVAVSRLNRIGAGCSRSVLLRSSMIPHLHARRRMDVAICCERLIDRRGGWTAMVHVGELRPILAGLMLILYLSGHGGGVRLTTSG